MKGFYLKNVFVESLLHLPREYVRDTSTELKDSLR